MRRPVTAAVTGAAILFLLFPAPPASGLSGTGCQLQGTARFAPGLTGTARDFTYSFNGNLSRCESSQSFAPATGTVSAGEVMTVYGVQYQEPVLEGSGSCAAALTQGVAIVTWADSTRTVISYTTQGAGAAVHLDGVVIGTVSLPALPPATGSVTITTTRYFAGASAIGVFAFQADPGRCTSSGGVTEATINGVTGLGTAP